MFSHHAFVGKLVCRSIDALASAPHAEVGHVLLGRSMCGQCASAGFVVENGCMLGITRPSSAPALPPEETARSLALVDPSLRVCGVSLLPLDAKNKPTQNTTARAAVAAAAVAVLIRRVVEQDVSS